MNACSERIWRIFSRSKNASLILPFLILLLSFKPEDENWLYKIPVVRKQLKVVKAFKSIRVDGDVLLVLTNAPTTTLIVEGKEKDVQKISPVFENQTLIIDARRKQLFSKLTIYLSALALETIELNGDGKISSLGLIKSDHLHLSLNGNIDIKIRTMGQISFDTPDGIELSKPLVYELKK